MCISNGSQAKRKPRLYVLEMKKRKKENTLNKRKSKNWLFKNAKVSSHCTYILLSIVSIDTRKMKWACAHLKTTAHHQKHISIAYTFIICRFSCFCLFHHILCYSFSIFIVSYHSSLHFEYSLKKIKNTIYSFRFQ